MNESVKEVGVKSRLLVAKLDQVVWIGSVLSAYDVDLQTDQQFVALTRCSSLCVALNTVGRVTGRPSP